MGTSSCTVSIYMSIYIYVVEREREETEVCWKRTLKTFAAVLFQTQ